MPEEEQIPDIRDIPPPPEVAEPGGGWVWLLIAAAAIIIILVAIFVILRLRKAKPAPQVSADPVREALRSLRHLSGGASKALAPRELADTIAAAMKPVLAQRFGEPSRALTADEFFDHYRPLIDKRLRSDEGRRLAGILGRCEQMRFAPTPGDAERNSQLVDSALRFLENLPAGPSTDDNPAAA